MAKKTVQDEFWRQVDEIVEISSLQSRNKHLLAELARLSEIIVRKDRIIEIVRKKFREQYPIVCPNSRHNRLFSAFWTHGSENALTGTKLESTPIPAQSLPCSLWLIAFHPDRFPIDVFVIVPNSDRFPIKTFSLFPHRIDFPLRHVSLFPNRIDFPYDIFHCSQIWSISN